MDYASLQTFLSEGKPALAKGPVGIILVEDPVEVDSTIRHHLKTGFKTLVIFAPPEIRIDPELAGKIHRIPWDMHSPGALTAAVNPLIAAAPEKTWMYYGYNAEYLFYPFCEQRSVGEMLAFHAEERRSAMLTYAVDLYAPDLTKTPDGVDLPGAMLDRSGYYALARPDPMQPGQMMERQLNFFGGLRWRFEEHISKAHRKIDRIALFCTAPGLELRPNYTFNIEEYNTYSCPWHHNLTAAIMSFRVAKGLKYNPGSTYDINDFRWYNSVRFDWTSQQLMDLGLIEPGQWF